jgi:hypothetical protein
MNRHTMTAGAFRTLRAAAKGAGAALTDDPEAREQVARAMVAKLRHTSTSEQAESQVAGWIEEGAAEA